MRVVRANTKVVTSSSSRAQVHRVHKGYSRLRMCKARPELAVEDKKPKRFSLTTSRPQVDPPEAFLPQLVQKAQQKVRAEARARNSREKLLQFRVHNNQLLV